MQIPEGYQTVMPYLILKDALKFSEFMKTVFDAKEKFTVMRDEKLVMHAEITIGASTIMFADSNDQYSPQPAGMFIYVDNADVTYKKALDAGATSVMEPATMEYGRSSGVKDPFENVWWITSVI